jgi:hypothetical protein
MTKKWLPQYLHIAHGPCLRGYHADPDPAMSAEIRRKNIPNLKSKHGLTPSPPLSCGNESKLPIVVPAAVRTLADNVVVQATSVVESGKLQMNCVMRSKFVRIVTGGHVREIAP